MKKLVTIIGILCGVTLALSACAAPGTASTATTASTQATAAATTATYTVDTRYSGEKVPDTVISGYLKAAGLENSTEPMDTLKAGTTWRCMDGKVYACNVGANLPCASQANTDKTPTQAMKDYCATNSEATDIPASVTGHETVYAWNCSKGAVVLGKQLVQPDAQGFLSDIWYAIEK
jgi:hypothetical protein